MSQQSLIINAADPDLGSGAFCLGSGIRIQDDSPLFCSTKFKLKNSKFFQFYTNKVRFVLPPSFLKDPE
jgi:hypothetical protein